MKNETIDKALFSGVFLTVTIIDHFLQLWLRGDYLKGKVRDVFDELGNDKKLKVLEVGCGCGYD